MLQYRQQNHHHPGLAILQDSEIVIMLMSRTLYCSVVGLLFVFAKYFFRHKIEMKNLFVCCLLARVCVVCGLVYVRCVQYLLSMQTFQTSSLWVGDLLTIVVLLFSPFLPCLSVRPSVRSWIQVSTQFIINQLDEESRYEIHWRFMLRKTLLFLIFLYCSNF